MLLATQLHPCRLVACLFVCLLLTSYIYYHTIQITLIPNELVPPDTYRDVTLEKCDQSDELTQPGQDMGQYLQCLQYLYLGLPFLTTISAGVACATKKVDKVKEGGGK